MKKITTLTLVCLLTAFFTQIKAKAQNKQVTVIVKDDNNDKKGKDKNDISSKKEKVVIINDDKDSKNGKTKKVIVINSNGNGSKENINISINGKNINIDESSKELEEAMEKMLTEMSVIAKLYGNCKNKE